MDKFAKNTRTDNDMSLSITSKKIVVIGSSNIDMTIIADRHPAPGETVLGGVFQMGAGGKGANQAVAAKRLGGNVEFFCKLGNDTFGENTKRHYEKEGLDVSHIMTSEKHSGVALITVDAKAENSIVVASGANSDITPDDIESIKDEIASAGILLLQLEIPIESVIAASRIGHENNAFVILNPAPASDLPQEIYSYISLIIPNETEASIMTGIKVTDEFSAEKSANILMARGIENVIITMGAKGSLLCTKGKPPIFTPSVKVKAVDTTAAGDTFCGGLCVALAEGRSMEEAIRFATQASSLTVQRTGAQDSIPMRYEISEN